MQPIKLEEGKAIMSWSTRTFMIAIIKALPDAGGTFF
jgi:hypothetical protein